MEESDKPPEAVAPRNTLKLKKPVTRTTPVTPRASFVPAPSAPAPRSREPANWADEHKSRMQADMDALVAGGPTPADRGRRR